MARPLHVATLMSALQFQDPRPELLANLTGADWERLLAFSDDARLTLILGHQCRGLMPECVQAKVDRDLAENTERLKRVQRGFEEVSEALEAAGADHLVLKGFAQWPYFIPDARLRPQYDLDLYCPPYSLFPARKALLKMGYEESNAPERAANKDHLSILVRIPAGVNPKRAINLDPTLAIDLHYQFWGPSYARFGPTNLGTFWARRRARLMGTLRFDALDPLDAFAYSALHALRHLLYGGLVPLHIYELAFFLEQNAGNDVLWQRWLASHDDQLRSLIAVSSLLASKWFACRIPAVLAEQIRRLPGIVPRWLEQFADSTLVYLFHFNKEALWLHLGLIASPREKRSLLLGRLFPLWVPPLNSPWVHENYEPAETVRGGLLRKWLNYIDWFATRVIRHLRVLPSTLWCGLRLWTS